MLAPAVRGEEDRNPFGIVCLGRLLHTASSTNRAGANSGPLGMFGGLDLKKFAAVRMHFSWIWMCSFTRSAAK